MLFRTLITIALLSPFAVCGENIAKEIRPYAAFPVPFELPNRNDRSDQCWLRVEDVELIETVSIFCYVALSFLRNHIHDYNSRKMTEDDVDISLWSEEPRLQDDSLMPKTTDNADGQKGIKDWKFVTVWDPMTRMRLYVTKRAVCRLVMYSREGMTNYKVDCERFLYYLNDRNNSSPAIQVSVKLFVVSLIALCIFGL